MISYGGIALGVDSPDDESDFNLNLETITTWLREHYDPRDAMHPVWATEVPLPAWPAEPGVLHWPVGATRCAVGWFLASDAMLALIRPQVYGSTGTSYNALPLTLADDTQLGTITTSMWMLPPRPLAQSLDANDRPQGNGLWLLTLVDDRYFWYLSPPASIAVTGGSTSFATLYAAIGAALATPAGTGVTITPDTVSSAYPYPSAALAVYGTPLPPALDACAAACGQRVVRAYNGAVTTQNAQTARAAVDAQKLAWNVDAGGEFQYTPYT